MSVGSSLQSLYCLYVSQPGYHCHCLTPLNEQTSFYLVFFMTKLIPFSHFHCTIFLINFCDKNLLNATKNNENLDVITRV